VVQTITCSRGLGRWLLWLWVRIPLKSWFVRVFLWCAVLWRWGLETGRPPPPPSPVSPTRCRIIIIIICNHVLDPNGSVTVFLQRFMGLPKRLWPLGAFFRGPFSQHFFFHRVCSGSIVSDYGLDDRAIRVRSPAEAKNFSSNLCVQIGCGAHPASCTMGTGGPFPGGKARLGRDSDHSPLSSAEVVNE
jgi:hypothetical protein